MRVFRYLRLALLLTVLLGGCEAMFEFNLFSGMEQVDLPDAESLNGMSEAEALAYLQQQMLSTVFVDALAADPQALQDVLDYLETHGGTPPPLTENEKLATILYADLQLKVCGGEDLVNNVAAIIVGGEIESIDSPAEAETFLADNLQNIIPPEAMASQEAFNTMLDGFDEAWDAYAAFAGSIDGDPDTDEVPEDVNMGDVTQKALFAFLIDEAVNDMYGSSSAGRQALWELANGQDPATAPSDYPDLSDPQLGAIFDEAGIDFGS